MRKRIFFIFALLLYLSECGSPAANTPVITDNLSGKLITGYQGWFGCPGDYDGNAEWQHQFFNNDPIANNLSIDLLPSTQYFNQADLCNTEMYRADGSKIYLYSAQNENIVETHFKWMADYGIDGAAIQRFIALAMSDGFDLNRCDNFLKNAQKAAEDNKRVFYVTYDVSGADSNTVCNDIEADWRHLVNDLQITNSPSYLRSRGKPVLEIWGFGFTDRPGEPGQVEKLINDLETGSGGLPPVVLIGGVPTNWRTLDGDSKTDPAWGQVYRTYNVISPWSVGRFSDDTGADNFLQVHVIPDLAETERLGIGYMPVIFPGFSWYNLQMGRGNVSQAIVNQIPRQCGNFLWHQVYNLLGAHVSMVYAAMFDEMDEGTALFPVAASASELPAGASMVYLDEDGCQLPDDWYLQITRTAAAFLRNGTTPPEQLDQVLTP